MRINPHLYEVNARIFLGRLSRKYQRKLTLATIPSDEWRLITTKGFDFIWLMGVWQRSATARQKALLHDDLRRRYDVVLSGWTDEDIAGSPYAVHTYTLDRSLGEQADLIRVKSMLHNRGHKLIVDFVPNHLALDTPWITAHPEWFVHGSKIGVERHPEWFFSPNGGDILFAHGRDPNFPPWTDTVQLNYFSVELRQAMVNQLLKIAELADGVRCDMAMLVLNDVFEKVWGDTVRYYPRLKTEFWNEVIVAVKEQYPNFIFIAEAYWGLERQLLKLGIDYVYDKVLYDRLQFAKPEDIRNYLSDSGLPLERAVHFIENHDEPRASMVFGRERSLAAALVVTTVPGLRLFYDGQLEGKHVHLPVQLIREPREEIDNDVSNFYKKVLVICNQPVFHDGEWKLLKTVPAWEGNGSYENLLAWSWCSANQLKVVVINYSSGQSQCRLRLPLKLGDGVKISYLDELVDKKYEGYSDEINQQGLYIDLGAWNAHILDMPVR
jgi:hypothetical protein